MTNQELINELGLTQWTAIALLRHYCEQVAPLLGKTADEVRKEVVAIRDKEIEGFKRLAAGGSPPA